MTKRGAYSVTITLRRAVSILTLFSIGVENKLRGDDNNADLFTKSLPAPAFRKFRDGLGIIDGRTSSYFR